MKKLILTPLLLMLFATGFAQNPITTVSPNLNFEVHGKYMNPVKKEKLENVQFLSDIIPSYPSMWIKGYISVELSIPNEGKNLSASSNNEILTSKQKELLNTVGIGSDV